MILTRLNIRQNAMITLPPLRDIPVAVFRSTDDAAPVLKGEKGSFKTLLKAVLVNGYGDKAPLGWTIQQEDTNTAIFKSQDATSNQHLLKIDHDTNSHGIRCSAGTALNSDGSLKNLFGLKDMGLDTPIATGTVETPWVIVGHQKAFVVLLKSTYNNYFGSVLYFGDVPSLIADDLNNTVLWATRGYAYFKYNNNYNMWVNFPASFNQRLGDTPTTPISTLSAYNQASFPPLGNYSNESNQLLLDKVWLRENPVVRAQLSGIFVPSLLLPIEWNLENCPLPTFEDYIVARLSEHSTQSNIMVNTVSWVGV